MTKETFLMQYQSECRVALKSCKGCVNISKPFEKTWLYRIISKSFNWADMDVS